MSDESYCRYIFSSKEYGLAMRSYWRHSRVKWFALVVIVGIVAANIYAQSGHHLWNASCLRVF